MEKVYSIQELKNMLKIIFDKYRVKKAILFGSVAKNTATEKSDVDILVDSGLRGISFFGLLGEIVELLHKKVDLIDTSQIEPGSKIDEEIKNTGVLLYG